MSRSFLPPSDGMPNSSEKLRLAFEICKSMFRYASGTSCAPPTRGLWGAWPAKTLASAGDACSRYRGTIGVPLCDLRTL
jgi:hypothetical protein